ATFLAQFAAHAAGHDACAGFCRGVRTGASLKSSVRSMAMWSVLCQLSWSRVHIAPARYGCMRRANGEEKRTQGRQVSYSVFSGRHTLHGSHVAGLVEENGCFMFRLWWTTMSACSPP